MFDFLPNFWRRLTYTLPRNLARLWSYLPIIWTDRDWDSHYLVRLMRHKAERMERYLTNYSQAVHLKKNLKGLRDLCQLLKRLEDDNYDLVQLEPHDQKWGAAIFRSEPIKDSDPKISRVHIARSNVKTAQNMKQERREFMSCMKRADACRHRDLRHVGALFDHHFLTWWD